MKCGHRSDCLSFLIRQVDNEVVPLDMCSPNACFQTLCLGKAGLEFPQVLGDRCVWPGWEVGVGRMKRGFVSLPSGKLVSQLAPCNQEARILHKYPDTRATFLSGSEQRVPGRKESCRSELASRITGALHIRTAFLYYEDRFLVCGSGDTVSSHVASMAPYVTALVLRSIPLTHPKS